MRYFLLTALLSCCFLQADTNTFSGSRLNDFYDLFVCEEKDDVSTLGITSPCEPAGSGRISPPVPSNPSCSSYIPIRIINNTGLADSSVFFVLYGKPLTGNSYTYASPSEAFVSFGTPPTANTLCGTVVPVVGVNDPSTATYSYALSEIPVNANGHRVVYSPYLDSANMIFSIGSKLTQLANGANSIGVPAASDTTDPNYNIVYGVMEITYLPPGYPDPSNPGAFLNQIDLDFTCVDFFGIPINFTLYTQNPPPGISQAQSAGIYVSRSAMLSTFSSHFSTYASPAASLTEWNSLILSATAGVTPRTLRVLSPGYSMSHTPFTFDVNYLDNSGLPPSGGYGFSWANDVWTGSAAYYTPARGNMLKIITRDGTEYQGKIISYSSVANFEFYAPDNGETFDIPWSDVVTTTTSGIFNTQTYFPGMTYSYPGVAAVALPGSASAATRGRANEVTQYLSSAISVGLIPGQVSTIPSNGFNLATIDQYYMPNGDLNPPGPTTGPWYDLYSKALHSISTNIVYGYPYDDYLYQRSPLNSQVAPNLPTVDSTTSITITLEAYSDL